MEPSSRTMLANSLAGETARERRVQMRHGQAKAGRAEFGRWWPDSRPDAITTRRDEAGQPPGVWGSPPSTAAAAAVVAAVEVRGRSG